LLFRTNLYFSHDNSNISNYITSPDIEIVSNRHLWRIISGLEFISTWPQIFTSKEISLWATIPSIDQITAIPIDSLRIYSQSIRLPGIQIKINRGVPGQHYINNRKSGVYCRRETNRGCLCQHGFDGDLEAADELSWIVVEQACAIKFKVVDW
jgi:hypothetical protein